MNNYLSFIDLINIFSFIIGLQNLEENETQSAKTIELLQENDVDKANDKQAHILLETLSTEFEQQNKTLAEIHQILQKVLEKVSNND